MIIQPETLKELSKTIRQSLVVSAGAPGKPQDGAGGACGRMEMLHSD